MILEGEIQNNPHPPQSSSFQTFSNENDRRNEESQISRIKWDYRNKIRIRELQKIKAQKRRIFQTNMTIKQILHSEFPKQSDQAKNWAHNLVQLFDSSKTYQTDPNKLRQIFLLAQKFPNLGTLKLFYLACINASCQTIRTLYDLDVWRFLHNILQFPNLKPRSNLIQIQETSFSPSSKNLNTLFVEIQMIKSAIETFVILFKKDSGFRDYSIGVHQTFSNYLKPAFRKYGESIKTEVIYFLKEVFCVAPKTYSREYLCILKFIIGMLMEYKEKFTFFFNKRVWNDVENKQNIQEAIKRAGALIATMYKLFSYIDSKWLFDMLQGGQLSYDINYLNVSNIYLQFGQCVLDKILNDHQQISSQSQLLENTIDFLHNSITFYLVYVEKTVQDGPQIVGQVPQIVRKTVCMLQFLKKCEENKVFNEVKRQLFLDIEKTKEACLFAIDFSLYSEFDNYKSFFRDFIFFEGKNGEQINLLFLLEYFLNTSQHDNIISELVNVIFSLLRMKIPQQEMNRFIILREMMEKICDFLADSLILQNTKQKICNYFLGYLEHGCGTLGWHLRIEDIFMKNSTKINAFMFSQLCSQNSYHAIDKVMKLIKLNHGDSHDNTVLI